MSLPAAIWERSHTLVQRLTATNPHADRLPSPVAIHFALALPEDYDRLAYLDTSIDLEGAPPRTVVTGQLVALTRDGLLIELSYRGEEEIGPVSIRPLRGRVTKIELSYDERHSEDGRVAANAISVTLSDSTSFELPITRRKDGAAFLSDIIAALSSE